MKRFLLILVLIVGCFSVYAQKTPNNKALNSRSDTINILNYTINLDITDYADSMLKGNCAVEFTPKINNINYIDLDLLELTVDSVTYQGNNLTYSYNDTLLHINLPTAFNIGDTETIHVIYHGVPQIDATGWGGFYFQNNYIYNMGVGFGAIPHNYGRVWFPCFDNFVEKSTYTFNITTADSMNAHCNGYLAKDSVIDQDTLFSQWIMPNEIPSYLACVAAARYSTVHQSYIDQYNDTIPIELVALPNDTTNVKNSFVHLDTAIATFERWYGPYRWNKIGYSMVPFTAGAMEHATNISYPVLAANGTTTYETTYAHELSHHWWGDLVTCEDAQQMWINEGMAHFSEFLFTERLSGHDAYVQAAAENNLNYLKNAAVTDSGHWALNNVPLAYTYGDHVYNKGALVAYNLRSYMGDSLFAKGLKYITSSYKFKNITSTQFRDALEYITSLNLHPFFNDWILNTGDTHISIDSVISAPQGANYQVKVYIHQKKRFSNHFFQNVPIQLTFRGSNWNKQTENISVSNEFSNFSFLLPFKPVFTDINENQAICQAVTSQQAVIKTTGNFSWNMADISFDVNQISDSTLLRVENHWIAPDSIKNNIHHYQISKNHYWSVEGIKAGNFQANATVFFDGRAGAGYIDSDLTNEPEDSVILLYRKSPAYDWQEFPYYQRFYIGSHSDAHAAFTIDSLFFGQYTFALGTSQYLGIKKNTKDKIAFNIMPNPAKNFININSNKSGNYVAKVYGLNGKLILVKNFNSTLQINTARYPSGTYILNILNEKGRLIHSQKYIVAH